MYYIVYYSIGFTWPDYSVCLAQVYYVYINIYIFKSDLILILTFLYFFNINKSALLYL